MESQTSQLYVPDSIIKDLPSMVRNGLATMSAQRQEEFVEEYRRKAKSLAMAYVCWLIFGIHYIYLQKIGVQIGYWVTLGGIGFWAIIDIFRIPGMVRDYNKDVAADVMRNLKAISN